MELTHRVKEKLGSCLIALVGGATEVKYCLLGKGVLKQEKVKKSTDDIAEIYKRINRNGTITASLSPGVSCCRAGPARQSTCRNGGWDPPYTDMPNDWRYGDDQR
jgi:hypothetical protein